MSGRAPKPLRLVLVRHAIAVPRGTPGIADRLRPLTPRGQRRFRSAAAGLARLIGTPDLLLSSPLVRARQTATLLARALGAGLPVRLEPALASATPRVALAALRRRAQAGEVLVAVGHEPQLSGLLALLLGATMAAVEFRKGGAALVELRGARARLAWFASPRLLRRLR